MHVSDYSEIHRMQVTQCSVDPFLVSIASTVPLDIITLLTQLLYIKFNVCIKCEAMHGTLSKQLTNKKIKSGKQIKGRPTHTSRKTRMHNPPFLSPARQDYRYIYNVAT